MIDLSQEQISTFNEDGFLFVDDLIDDATAEEIKAHYERMFRGDFETGIRPDEVNWQEGKSDPSLTRQICNGWKGDRAIARIVLREDVGRACAILGGWPGARIKVDNVLWKPPGTRPLGMHQDSAYLAWINPSDMISCWIALDDTTANSGTMELVRGSHKWRLSAPEGEFHGPDDYQKYMRIAAAAEGIAEPEIVPVVAKKGGGSFHHGWTWHGSGYNTATIPRRSLVSHCISSEAEYVPENIKIGTGPMYGRYMHHGDRVMDEDYFPIIWTRDGHRTAWLDGYLGAA